MYRCKKKKEKSYDGENYKLICFQKVCFPFATRKLKRESISQKEIRSYVSGRVRESKKFHPSGVIEIIKPDTQQLQCPIMPQGASQSLGDISVSDIFQFRVFLVFQISSVYINCPSNKLKEWNTSLF